MYEISPEKECSTPVAKLDQSQIVSLLRLEDGTLVVGAANGGAVARIDPTYAAKGTFVSKPLDAKQIVRFGRARWRASVPEGTHLTLSTRSGNVEDEDSPTWTSGTPEADATAGVQIASASARFRNIGSR